MSDEPDDLVELLEEAGYEVAFDYTPTSEQAAAASARIAAKEAALGALAGTLPVADIDWHPHARWVNPVHELEEYPWP